MYNICWLEYVIEEVTYSRGAEFKIQEELNFKGRITCE